MILLCMNLGHFVPSPNNYPNHFVDLYLALLLGHILYNVGGLTLLTRLFISPNIESTKVRPSCHMVKFESNSVEFQLYYILTVLN